MNQAILFNSGLTFDEVQEIKRKASDLMDVAADLAEANVIRKLGKSAWVTEANGDNRFTDDAQDMFNVDYELFVRAIIH